MPDTVVRLENLGKQFPGTKHPALAGLSAGIRAGIVTGLVGPDGAGKTTLMRLIAGLLGPTSGTVLVNRSAPAQATTGRTGNGSPAPPGQPRSNAATSSLSTAGATDLREFIGYMPQKFGLYEDLTVLENLELHADLRGVLGAERRTAFQRLLDFTDLSRFTSRLAGRLSGGMKQKLGLGCALLGHPGLLLLDEPGVGVDPISRRELWKMVHELVGQGLTVVWSTAYLDEAELCAEVLLLNEGRLLFAGRPSDLTDRVRDRCLQIRRVSGSRRQLLARALRRPEVLDGVIQGHNVRLVLREGAARPNLEELDAGPEAKLVPVAPRFEDAFIDVLGGGPGGDSVLAQRVHQVAGEHETVVEAVELTKRFGDFAAADRVTFAVKRGEIFGLLGPNGAGKSTTFRMMCGLLTPTAGTARVMGIDLKKSPSQARQRLGYMAQKFSLYGNLTVKQNLEFFSGAYGLRGTRQKQVVEGMVEVFKLEPLLGSAAETLPLGFKQRLALACAVMHEPDILFLDEPTSGVDPVTRREFWTHINGLVEKGVTVMITTHFMDEAEYCDRIALVFRGRIIAASTPDQLKAQAETATRPEPSMEDAFIELVQKEAQEDRS
jgi:ABC-2 type transport system ATP-binding protein